jgi:hypothetical protein
MEPSFRMRPDLTKIRDNPRQLSFETLACRCRIRINSLPRIITVTFQPDARVLAVEGQRRKGVI